MAQSITGTSEESSMTDDTDDVDVEAVAMALRGQMTAEELRRLAAHADGVSRERGATKAETAEQVAEQAPEFAATVAEGGDFHVACTCGLHFTVDHPQTALREAKRHKEQRITHFPRAVDQSSEDEAEHVHIYG